MRRWSCIYSIILSFCCVCFPNFSSAAGIKGSIPLEKGGTLPVYSFMPCGGIKGPLPGVVVAVGVGSQNILQYHAYCQHLADCNFAVVLIDPSNYPEKLAPGPFSWDRGAGSVIASINQGVVAGKLLFSHEWYVNSMKAAVDFLCRSPFVDRSRIVVSGFSQPANAALTLASRDPRISAVVWNYGGSPWILPYEPLRLPPVLIFHGADDDVYDVKYARKLAFDLHTNARYYEIYIYPHQKHMFNVLFDLQTETRLSKPVIMDSFSKLLSFLKRTLNLRG